MPQEIPFEEIKIPFEEIPFEPVKKGFFEALGESLKPSSPANPLGVPGVISPVGMQMMEVLGNVAATPSRLLYSAFSDEPYTEALSKKTELGRAILGDTESLGGALGAMALDVVGDPVNLIGGIGVLGKLSKGVKLSSELTDLTKVTKSEQFLEKLAGKSEKHVENLLTEIDKNIRKVDSEDAVKLAMVKDHIKQATGRAASPLGKDVLIAKDFTKEGDLTDEGFEKATDILKSIISEISEKNKLPKEELMEFYNITKSGEYRSMTTPILEVPNKGHNFDIIMKTFKKIVFKKYPDKIDEFNEVINQHRNDILNNIEKGLNASVKLENTFQVNPLLGRLIKSLDEIDDAFKQTTNLADEMVKQATGKTIGEAKSAVTGFESLSKSPFETLIKEVEADQPFRKGLEEGLKPMGKSKQDLPGYNVETMNPKLKESLPETIESVRKEFNLMRGERMTNEQLSNEAVNYASKLTDEAVLKSGRETQLATEVAGKRIYANARILESTEKLSTVNKFTDPDGFKAALDDTKQALHIYLKTRAEGTEVARALQGMSIQVKDELINSMNGLRTALAKVDPESAAVLNNMMRDLNVNPGFKDKALFWYYNFMLSHPFTDMANVIGNTSHLGWEVLQHTLSEKPSNVLKMYKGIGRGWKKGTLEAKKIISGEQATSKFLTEGELQRYDLRPDTKLGKGLKSLLPTTRLAVEDAFFWNMGQEMQRSLQASKYAKKMGVDFGDILKSMDNIIKNPKLAKESPELQSIINYADQYADFVTFRSPLKSKFAKGLQETVWVKPVVPFVRVAANIMKAGYKNTPVGFIKLLGKEAKNLSKVERTEITRRALAGTTMMAGIGSMVLSEKVEITGGGPNGRRERALWEAMNYKPNHIYWVNDDGSRTGVSYQNVNPFNVPLAVMGNWMDEARFGKTFSDDETTLADKFGAAIIGTAATMLDQSFMQGASQLISAIENRDSDWFYRFATNPFIPNIVSLPRDVERISTGKKPLYDADGVWERLKTRVGLTEGIPPRYNAFGEQRQSGYERFPIFPTTTSNDPLLVYMQENGLTVSTASKRTKINDRELTRDEYSEYSKIRGEELNKMLRQSFSTIQMLNKENAQDFIDKLTDRASLIAKSQLRRKR